jgi:sugar lactone lactonase YvrE
MIKQAALFASISLFFACGGSQPPADEPTPEPTTAPEPATTGDAPPTTDKPPEEKPAPEPQAPRPDAHWEGFQTPESVLYDEANDRYLVSNINGKPLDADGNGYISTLSPDGKIDKEKFIAGGTAKAKLDAPKGLGIVKGVLWVSDITVVRKFDLKTGAPKGEVAIPGATFLNDLAVGADGSVYVSDSGMKQGEKDFEPTGTDAVWVIDKTGKPKSVAKSGDLNRPNGVLSTDKGVLVVAFGGNELVRLDDKGARQDVTKLPKGGLDGVVSTGDRLLVSSWQGSAIYAGTLGGTFEVAIAGLKSPADIGYDTKRKRVLVPSFLGNTVDAYAIK